MKYDIVIVGGGLSGLVAGIRLQKAGRKVAIISSGQGALHFSTGSFGLYGTDAEGNDVASPLEAIPQLPEQHPYIKIGVERVRQLVDEVIPFFAEAGLTMKGSAEANHQRLTPVGLFKPAWLSAEDCAVCPSVNKIDWGSTVVVGIKGYLDFYPEFLIEGLRKAGIECRRAEVSTPELEKLRNSAAEMRAPSIARVLRGQALDAFAEQLKLASYDAQTIILPSVIGLNDETAMKRLREITGKRIYCVPTQPMSVTGMRMMLCLRRAFERFGGTYLLGDNVTMGNFSDDGRLVSINTTNLGEAGLEADTYILATGSYFSRGLTAAPDRIYETVFNFDVNAPLDRMQWYATDFFAEQPYMSYGVRTDEDFHVFRSGRPLGNVLAAGAILGGCNSLKEGSGSGVAVLTALEVADRILKH